MILGIGTDILLIDRIKKVHDKYGVRFANKLLTAHELLEFKQQIDLSQQARFLAKKFASKEAILKAIGTGISTQCNFNDIDIRHDSLGKPIVRLSKRVHEFLDRSRNSFTEKNRSIEAEVKQSIQVLLSLSDENNLVSAFAILQII